MSEDKFIQTTCSSPHRPIIIQGLDAIVFNLRENFCRENKELSRIINCDISEIKKMFITTYNPDGSFNIKDNPDYVYPTKEEKKQRDIAREHAKNIQDEYVLQCLIDEYPDKDYADIFKDHLERSKIKGV